VGADWTRPQRARSYSSAPELNDVLHLQCKGIVKLENLEVGRAGGEEVKRPRSSIEVISREVI
jgi:hypothetical protein